MKMDLMMVLTTEDVKKLKYLFQQRLDDHNAPHTWAGDRDLEGEEDEGLTLEEFVKVMFHCLRNRMNLLEAPSGGSVAPSIEVDFAAACIDLFRQIDVNGDGTLEWDEFSGFMMQLNHVSGDANSICKTHKVYRKVGAPSHLSLFLKGRKKRNMSCVEYYVSNNRMR